MGRVYTEIDEKLAGFIEAQHVFFVATAPLAGDGLVNLSPKGLDSFSIHGPNEVAYLDLVGSGVETVAHVRENGRIVIMFCAFEGPPRIVRLHGRGRVLEPGDPGFAEQVNGFPAYESARSIIQVAVRRISDSCGYGVPLMHFESERAQLRDWANRKGADGIARYKADHNRRSLDGLPGLLR
jgi:hypothetical protein